ncbi:dTDP-4-dehydrorhamnose reductase [Clostridium sp. YIM B02555]|uniref:dTDP-4-dehydrorhamnose reductase n=1 Tax=Clostridium sp. YIM B02555 TaxID=2911968 RepID=UPI001EEE7682|nr:dTDP-4-dehydrorhamnose reductase [Clostridium sp. YIM B02555]
MILVTGVNGQLGFDVIRELSRRKIDYCGIARKDLDITNRSAVLKYISGLNPECVIHCAAYTAVEKAEEEPDVCYEANVNGTENIASACKSIDAKMIYISTEYVFNGNGSEPVEIDHDIKPLSVYGKSKYEGELQVQKYLSKYFIVRISWVFGINGNNFVKTMLRLGKDRSSLDVVSDQVGSPTYTFDLASLLCDMAVSEKYGVYHATNEGFCSWAQFAEIIMEKANLGCNINHITSADYKSKVIRPLNSRMSKKSLIEAGFKLLPKWQDALDRFFIEMKLEP